MAGRTTRLETKMVLVALAALVMVSGCSAFKSRKNSGGGDTASTMPVSGPRSVYQDFGDVLLPGDLKRELNDSFVFTTAGLTAGLICLSGRVEPNSLIAFFENRMPDDGWQRVSAIKSSQSMLLFRKASRWCVISIVEGKFTTHVKVWVAPTIGSQGAEELPAAHSGQGMSSMPSGISNMPSTQSLESTDLAK